MTKYGRSVVALGAIIITAAFSGCSSLGGRDDADEAKGRLGLKAERNPFTGERRGGRRDERSQAQRDQARADRKAHNEVSSEDMAREQAERRNRAGGPRVADSGAGDEIWFGMSTDGGFILQHIEEGDPNDYGLVRFKTNEDGEFVLDADGNQVIDSENPELYVFQARSTTRAFDPDELHVYTRGRARVIRSKHPDIDPIFAKVELPGGHLDAEGRDEDGFLGSDVVYAMMPPKWLSDATHNRHNASDPNAPAVRDIPAMNLFSSAAADFYGDEQQGWLYVDDDTLKPESEDMGECTNPLFEWSSCRRLDGKHALRLWATDEAANETVRRRLVTQELSE